MAFGDFARQDEYEAEAAREAAAERLRRGNIRQQGEGASRAEAAMNALGAILKPIVETPGRTMAPNPYPPGSEEASAFEDRRSRNANVWAGERATDMIGTGLVTKPGVATVGSGAIRMQRPAGGGVVNPDLVNAAARESAKGITQPELRRVYADLGLTGRDPSAVVAPSLAAKHPEAAIQAAIDLKRADRAVLDTLTPAQRRDFQIKGQLPGGALTPSQEAALPGLEAFKPVKKEITKAEKAFDADVARGVKPTIFDLSPQTLNQVPRDVPQFNLPRVAPEITERLASVPRGGLARLERAAAAAPEENWGWYNLMQARDRFHQLHGSQKGEQVWNAWLDSVAGTSMVNPIDNNIRSSTYYLQQVLQGKPLPESVQFADKVQAVKTLVGGPPPGYGAKSQIQHADRVREYMTHSYDPVTNPKPISYRTNLSGNWSPRTVDTHDIRNVVGMPLAKTVFSAENASLLPKEYAYLESIGQRAADRAGSTQAAQQAATWVGGGEYTGLKSYPAPLMEALNRRAHVTAKVRGITPDQAIDEAFTGVRPLLGLAGAGATGFGTLAAQDNYRQ